MITKTDFWVIKNLFEQLEEGNYDTEMACKKLSEYVKLQEEKPENKEGM